MEKGFIIGAGTTGVLFLVSYLASRHACIGSFTNQGCGNGEWFAGISLITLFAGTIVAIFSAVRWRKKNL